MVYFNILKHHRQPQTVEWQQDRELESLLVQYGEEEGERSPPCPLLMCYIQSGRRKTQLMFQVEQQQDRELESLLVQYREEEGERSPPCPLLMCFIQYGRRRT